MTKRGCAVRDVADQMRVRGRRLLEALDLRARELLVRIRRRQMAHQPDDLDRRRGKLGQPPAAHARVELEMDANALRDRLVPDGQVEIRLAGLRDLAAAASGP